MLKVAVVGGRDFENYPLMKKTFLELLKEVEVSKEDVMIISGGAKGADSLAQRLAKELGLPILIFYPDWSKGKRAGLERNTKIVKNSDVVLAFPTEKSRGTWDTIRKAQRIGKRTIVVKP